VLRFWDVGTGRQVRAVKLQGNAGPGRAVTLSPDGKVLAAHDGDKIVLWEVESGKELKALPAQKRGVGFLYFSPDGKTLAVGKGDWRVSMWDWAAGKESPFPLAYDKREVVQFHMDSSFHGGFSPDGKWFVAGASCNEPLGVFEAATGREVHRLRCHAITSTVSPDSKRLAVCGYLNDKGGREAVLRLFDLASGKETAQFPLGHEDCFHSLAFSPDGKLLACGGSDRSCVVDTASGRVLYRLSGRQGTMAFSPDGKSLAAGTGHRLRFWNAAGGKEIDERPGEFGYSPALAVSPDGRWLASADWMAQDVSLWDTRGGRLLRRLPVGGTEKRYVRNVAFSGDGRTLVAGRAEAALQFWDGATGKEQRTLQLHDPDHPNKDYVYCYQLHVSSDGKRVSTLERIMRPGEGTRLALWESATGKLLHQHSLPSNSRECAWSADGLTVALLLNDGLTLMEVDTGVVRFRAPGATSGQPPVASPDGRLLAAWRTVEGKPPAVGVWEAATGKEVATVATGPFAHLALAADSRSLVTTDTEFLRVWDLATGKEWGRWPLPVAVTDSWGQTFVYRLLLSPDGRRAFTALADGTCLVWDLSAARDASPLVERPSEKEVAGWWADLAGADAGRAYAAVWRLGETPDAVAFLRRHLRPASDADLKKARELITELDSDSFDAREKAFRQLEGLGSGAVPALRETLTAKPSPEARRRLEALLSRASNAARPPEERRRLRAILVLEQIASKEARALVGELAAGAPYAAQTAEAKAALGRLDRRAAGP
jgi:WD40 repeat protein